MRSKEEVLQAVEDGIIGKCLDGRDLKRLLSFFEPNLWIHFGYKKDDAEIEILPWKEETILNELKSDLAFAFEKALNKRGLSSSFMYEVVKMWLWILEDPLYDFKEYAMYGLPLFKKVAVKYGFDNPIGDDVGNEDKYDEDVIT